MAKDRDGNTIKVGDTVEVIDGSGSDWFNDKLGKRFKVTSVSGDQTDDKYGLIGVESSNGHQQFAYRFKKIINAPVFEVGNVVSSSYPLNYSNSNPWGYIKDTEFTIQKVAPREYDKKNPNWYNVGKFEFPECDLTLIRKGNEKVTFNVGDQLKHNSSSTIVYTVLYTDKEGMLITWKGDNRAFIRNYSMKEYTLVVPEKWVYIYKDGYNKLTVSVGTYPTETEAKKIGVEYFGVNFIQVLKLEK